MAKISFEPPAIFGALCDKKCCAPAPLKRAISSHARNAVLLPFLVERRFLKNVVACMRLMDVMGLVVLGGHQKAIMRHLPRLHASARCASKVDTIIRRDNTFVGLNSLYLARQKRLKDRKCRHSLRTLALDICVELLTNQKEVN